MAKSMQTVYGKAYVQAQGLLLVSLGRYCFIVGTPMLKDGQWGAPLMGWGPANAG